MLLLFELVLQNIQANAGHTLMNILEGHQLEFRTNCKVEILEYNSSMNVNFHQLVIESTLYQHHLNVGLSCSPGKGWVNTLLNLWEAWCILNADKAN